jgi:hypothetical protein
MVIEAGNATAEATGAARLRPTTSKRDEVRSFIGLNSISVLGDTY